MSAEPQPESPFVETESEGSLRRIAEVARARKDAKGLMAIAKAKYKAAREDYAKACEEELAIIDAETTELPLFPRLKPDEGGPDKPAGMPGPEPGPKSPDVAPIDDPRSKTWLSDIGLSQAIVIKLGEAGLMTVGDLAKFTAGGKQIKDIKGIGEATAELILDCLANFWGNHPAA